MRFLFSTYYFLFVRTSLFEPLSLCIWHSKSLLRPFGMKTSSEFNKILSLEEISGTTDLSLSWRLFSCVVSLTQGLSRGTTTTSVRSEGDYQGFATNSMKMRKTQFHEGSRFIDILTLCQRTINVFSQKWRERDWFNTEV